MSLQSTSWPDRRHFRLVHQQTGVHQRLKRGLDTINTLGLGYSNSVDLNDAGQVIGIGCLDSGNGCADTLFRFSPGLGMENLGGLAGGRTGSARDINAHGDFVGSGAVDVNDLIMVILN